MPTKKAPKNKMQQAGRAMQSTITYMKMRADELEEYKERDVRSGIEAKAYYADFLARTAAELLQIRNRIVSRSTYHYLDTSWHFRSKVKRAADKPVTQAVTENTASLAA